MRIGTRLTLTAAVLVAVVLGTYGVVSLQALRVRIIVVTQGPGGATLYTRTASQHVPGFAVDSIDTPRSSMAG